MTKHSFKPAARTLRTNLCHVLVIAAAAVFSSAAHAAIYVKFDGIDGESSDASHKSWSDLLNTSLSVSVTSSLTTGGRTRGAPVFDDFAWTQEMDQSYPSLFSRITRGEITPGVDIDYTFTPLASGAEETYFSIHFDTVALTGLQFNANSNERGEVLGSFAFEKIELTYFSFVNGNKVGEFSAAYDLRAAEGSANFAEVLALGLSGAPATVPVPAAIWMFVSAMLPLFGIRRHRARLQS